MVFCYCLLKKGLKKFAIMPTHERLTASTGIGVLAEMLKTITVPTEIIHGDEDENCNIVVINWNSYWICNNVITNATNAL